MDTLISFGGSVKALGDGKVGGYLVIFGDASTPDLSRERDFFTAETDFDMEETKSSSVYYAHGQDEKIGKRKIGVGPGTMKKADEVGVWVETQLNLRDAYEKEIYGMAQKGRLGWSSGTAPHLVTRKAIKTDAGTVHEILSWPLGLDSSLTPTPAEPRTSVIALKSLPDLIGIHADEDEAKTLPSGFTYRDHIRFLESELNEDFGRQGSCDPWDSYSPSIYYWVENLKENPDTVIYHRSDEPGDTFSRPYTVANNDAVWGDEQEVIETTTYVDAPNDDAVPMMAGKQADVTALKAMLRDSMTLDDHADVVRDAMSGFVARAESLADLSVKAGKPMSAARYAKLKGSYAGLRTAHDAMGGHLETINDMLLSTDPDAKKDADDFAALRTRFVRLQSELLHLTG